MGQSHLTRRPDYPAFLHCLLLTFLALTLTVSTGCGEREAEKPADSQPVEGEIEGVSEQPQGDHIFQNYRETGDLQAIKKRGIIRFVHLYEDPGGVFARTAIVSQSHDVLAKRLADQLGLKAQFLVALTPQQGIDMVINGEADVIADNLEATQQRRDILGLSEPLQRTSRVLVTGKKGPDISDPAKLKNVELTVLADSMIAVHVHKFVAEHPAAKLTVRELLADQLMTQFLDSMDGDKPLTTVIQQDRAESLRRYHGDVKVGGAIGEPVAMVWAVRKDARELQTRINNFLTKTLVTAPGKREADWSSIKKSGVLRFATYNGPSYALWKGVLTGLDYELARDFAEKNDLELQMIVVPDKHDLIDYVKSGRADIAGATSTITQSRERQGIAFSQPILETSQRALSNKDSPPIDSLQDLNGRTLVLRAHSAFIETAQRLRQKGIDLEIEVAPEGTTFMEIIRGVAEGKFDATLEDSNLADLQIALYPQLVKGAVVSDPLPQGWMVAEGNETLLGKVDGFLKGFLENKENRAMVDSYFRPDEQLLNKAKARLLPGGKLSPFDELVRKYALQHNLDWRLVVAQMWQESNFDPKAESHVGAQGLMQVMPRTAQEMGFRGPLFDPEHSVHAGTKYLNWVRDRFEDDLPADEKLWFSLAAYNAGIGHLRDARALASQLGLDPNQWFDNVEVAMLKLSEPRYFEKARYGYARGQEPVLYVRNIRNLYRAYTDIASGDTALMQSDERQPLNMVGLLRHADYSPSTCTLPSLPAGITVHPIRPLPRAPSP
ncbi:Membrane-bound lytic murein transglycosylase F precursor [Microbulbifer aggregans]|uniref:Membrane-bound lytic murein transglycosylase F n=1 Tax=Microbulbifer aggregans TaxID=1769779 RepID=A0A1C9WBM9_9GAMM|nr:transporter substrate-binding domain-containing protein [Microbulbifer aggregans]AOS98551.1 Membrane-bound lytic murein transglycosylase F precursor [Microbulbifer aggregans]